MTFGDFTCEIYPFKIPYTEYRVFSNLGSLFFFFRQFFVCTTTFLFCHKTSSHEIGDIKVKVRHIFSIYLL